MYNSIFINIFVKKETMNNWDFKFIELTKYISEWSKDKSTKTGAVIVDKDHRIISIGYNGFPSGCNDDIESRHDRPKKYLYTEHAERNAIFNACRSGIILKGCSIYIMWFPCADCARAIIQSGIDTVYCYKPDLNDPTWGVHFKAAIEMFDESGINVIYLDSVKYKKTCK